MKLLVVVLLVLLDFLSKKIVFNFIKHIVDKNYHMYVTDVYKVWVEQKEYKKSHLLFKNNESTIFKELLREELDIIDPKIIITFFYNCFQSFIIHINILIFYLFLNNILRNIPS